MQRIIVTPPALAPAALAELKQWLGITTAADDAPLAALLAAALDACAGFTGMMPLQAVCEEMLPAVRGWQVLATRPVQAITALYGLAPAGPRFALAADAWEVDLDADGGGRVRLTAPASAPAPRIAVRFTAGLAPDWHALPDGLRHGVMRLAAHQHRERETSGAAPLPPAAVAALWRPWRRLRLA
ncbi:MAG: hypothetical protein LBV50_08240 [Novosphingobium sp.]|jgi:uncharacterized phiE125 gp8 family phage protein|nr:hypothetical protein [Novosphingobium sp.]